jgi:alpha/beta superfamily hydrolase
MSNPRGSQPLYFGDPARPLFGWLHRSTAATPAAFGLVICNPIGYEAVCAHRSIKHIAMLAANAGFASLRFDYDGTGDSAGDDLDARRVDRWIESIHHAVETLKRHAQVDQVVILGIRLGATLAALASAGRKDVAGFVAIAPVINLKSYLRELRVLALAGEHNAPAAQIQGANIQESAGFALTEETRAALATVDLSTEAPPAARVLILDRDDLPANGSWAQHLRTNGATVQHLFVEGYPEMMLDAHQAVVPARLISSTLDWLAECAKDVQPCRFDSSPAITLAHAASFTVDLDDATGTVVLETASFLDSDQQLFGIVTEPALPSDRERTAVLLINAGAVHHIGPNRLYVTLARTLAAQGIVSVRLDLSGLGDSSARHGRSENEVYGPHALSDIAATVKFMRQHHAVAEFHALGLCSGAYHGFKAAAAGTPFRSVVAINPLTFSWRPGMSLAFPEHRIASDIIRYRSTAFHWASWKKLLRGDVDVIELLHILARRAAVIGGNVVRDLARRFGASLPNDLGSELHKLAGQRTNMVFVFASGEPGLDLLRGGGGSMVRRLQKLGSLRIEMIDRADHTFTPRVARHQLIAALTDWAREWGLANVHRHE